MLIPIPIPACVYGLVIMFLLLNLKIIKIGQVKEVSYFLIEIMPLMFIPAGVGLMNSFSAIKPYLLTICIITIITTILVMGVSGLITELILKNDKKERLSGDNNE